MKDIEMTELDRLRHSSAHIMAAAVCRIYDDVQLDIGPPTEDGFYYDFELNDRISTEDFSKIEKPCRRSSTKIIPSHAKKFHENKQPRC